MSVHAVHWDIITGNAGASTVCSSMQWSLIMSVITKTRCSTHDLSTDLISKLSIQSEALLGAQIDLRQALIQPSAVAAGALGRVHVPACSPLYSKFQAYAI